jgi:hypothetical protein
MVSLLAFLAELLSSLVDLVVVGVTEVLLNDPLGAIAFLAGSALFVVTFGFGAYLVVGALLKELGIELPAPGRTSVRELRGRRQ